ncbi:NB-ARC domain-containing protein [Actinomadura madurae]|nr:NB-ARC domain-containing protein [Actinomadura madurae]MCQ0005748.1 NB-ARC domain-containing protein [Actinomadura madurae]
MALAGAGGAAVVQMMVSDGWESAKGRLARLLGRGTPAEVTAMEDRLESARTQLASLPEHELEQAMRVQAAVWQERLVDLLEAAPEVEEELRGLVGRVDARQGTTGVRQQAVLLSGIQINRFSAPPSLDEAIGTIAVPAGRRYEDAPLRGRDELIAELVEALSRPGSAERVHLLHGLGGAGKSSVALEVACRVQEKGAGVWWIPASDAGRVTMGMLNLARRLRLSDAEIAHRDVADLIWERLADRDTPWLLVFDNADDPAVLTIDDAPLPDGTGWLRPVATAAGMAIVTSRHGRVPDWGGWCRAHDVGMLTPAEGAQVLLDGTGSKAGSRADAESLSRRLGGLPLALRLAGSYLAQSQQMPRIFADPERARTFAEYRSALDVDPPEAGFPSQQMQVSDREARQMLGRTWELSLELLERRGTGPVRALLNLLSCFADAPIPYEMLLLPRLLAESEIFPSSTTGGEIWQSLVALSDTGLLDLDSPSHEEDIPVLRLHPLVRDVSRPREQEDRYLTTAAKVLVGATHGEQSGLPEDPAKWEVWQFLVPHARQVLDAVSALPRLGRQARLDSAKAAYMSGRHLASTGAYAQARAVYAEVFAIRSRLLGLDHEDTLSAHYGIARMAAAKAGTARRRRLSARSSRPGNGSSAPGIRTLSTLATGSPGWPPPRVGTTRPSRSIATFWPRETAPWVPATRRPSAPSTALPGWRANRAGSARPRRFTGNCSAPRRPTPARLSRTTRNISNRRPSTGRFSPSRNASSVPTNPIPSPSVTRSRGWRPHRAGTTRRKGPTARSSWWRRRPLGPTIPTR